MGVLTLLCVGSLFARYRGAGTIERQQIKWLLYTCGLFAIAYAPGFFVEGNFEGLAADLSNFFVSIVVIAFPIAIGIAILRFRLFDIDVILRRTVTYAIVTGVLVLVFFGSVIVLQRLLA